MTLTPERTTVASGTPLVPAAPPAPPVVPEKTVTFQIDGVETTVPKGTLVIRAAERLGIQIPRFCDHPLLAPAGACRQCLVEVWAPGRDGNLAKMPKPQASCTLEATDGMQVRTQHTSPEADKAQHGVMELLLVNHPLDCPVCDKGGECPLQNQAMSNGRATSRFVDVKRTFPKPIAISTQILLDRERCVLCQRCTRFSEEIAGDVFIDLQMRGARQQIGTFDTRVLDFAPDPGTGDVVPGGEAVPSTTEADAQAVVSPDGPVGVSLPDASGRPFSSYFSGNTVQICPVGALTSAAYRFRSRPFDLVSTPGIAEHDSSGSAIRVDHRRGVVLRRLAAEDPTVNQEWLTDKDRFAFRWQAAPDRLTVPMVRTRHADGTRGPLEPVSWTEALDVAAEGLSAALAAVEEPEGVEPGLLHRVASRLTGRDEPVARPTGGVGLLPGGRLTLEDAYAWAKTARVVLGTNDVDLRARPHSAEEAAFLAHAVAGRTLEVTYADVAAAPVVLLAGLEAEDEGGILFLRLREQVTKRRARVLSVAPWASRGLQRLDGTLLPAAPGTEAEVLDGIAAGARHEGLAEAAELLAQPGAVVLVGERLAGVRGGLSAALRLAARTGARLAWVPRRAGERGGVEAGALPGLLPGGRVVTDAGARVDVAAAWGVPTLPSTPGRSTGEILAAAAAGQLGALLVGGVDPGDLPDPAAALEALAAVPFLVSLEVRASAVTELADVVLPVAPPVEKAGTFVTWEGRPRPFPQALVSTALPDHRVLHALADAMGVDLGLRSLADVHAELDVLGGWDGGRASAPDERPAEPVTVPAGHALLATWHGLLDAGRLQDGDVHLAGTAPRPVARLSAATAAAAGVADGEPLTVSTAAGSLTLPAVVTAMPDHVVWLPTNAPGCPVRAALRADAGDLVALAAASAAGAGPSAGAAARPAVTGRVGGDAGLVDGGADGTSTAGTAPTGRTSGYATGSTSGPVTGTGEERA
ncbi:NADH-quinone oxidoreductase subunit G [Cellulomonas marina]|uniref:NADH-quinone oxidoreductase subunit G n=1 Tax=Cellulomonas marina TaxID=988821 RepID=A0A1I0XJP6_9CELL|nr:NADH-quinone oxidoreductase subunit G [Cellulomonas marina]GIG30102.1 NADH-quinone oxidoreductase [Cellulomonas marina]SFB01245.1 NADH-quinone oxidoreductase subunit G [Cellulomonas marina]